MIGDEDMAGQYLPEYEIFLSLNNRLAVMIRVKGILRFTQDDKVRLMCISGAASQQGWHSSTLYLEMLIGAG